MWRRERAGKKNIMIFETRIDSWMREIGERRENPPLGVSFSVSIHICQNWCPFLSLLCVHTKVRVRELEWDRDQEMDAYRIYFHEIPVQCQCPIECTYTWENLDYICTHQTCIYVYCRYQRESNIDLPIYILTIDPICIWNIGDFFANSWFPLDERCIHK